MKHILKWAAVAVPITLTGCAGMVVVDDPLHPPNYFRNVELYAVRNGHIRVEVVGNTFGLPHDQFATLVVNLMRETYYQHDWFTREASRATDPRFKIVMMFDPDPAVSGRNLCEAVKPYQPVPPAPGGTTHLLAAFCGDTGVISEIMGRAYGGITGVKDPKFKELIAKVISDIIPEEDPAEEPASWGVP